ncbi:hypothetical protein RJ55_06208 [Drechmeria coniospora]|nr:hypothetical protein RJ55_06208 [Drechmeria coniospora]
MGDPLTAADVPVFSYAYRTCTVSTGKAANRYVLRYANRLEPAAPHRVRRKDRDDKDKSDPFLEAANSATRHDTFSLPLAFL